MDPDLSVVVLAALEVDEDHGTPSHRSRNFRYVYLLILRYIYLYVTCDSEYPYQPCLFGIRLESRRFVRMLVASIFALGHILHLKGAPIGQHWK